LRQIKQLPHDVLEIKSHDGLRLKGIYYPCEGGNGATVICVHGYTSHAEREWAFPGIFYHSMGYNVLIPYQRAHGMSEGKYITFGALEKQDMLKWVEKVNNLRPDDPIVIHGLSMGGGIVLLLADQELRNVKCLISDAPNVSINKVFRNIIGGTFKDGHDAIFDRFLERYKKEFGVDFRDCEAEDAVCRSRYPILFAAGSNEKFEELFGELKASNPMDSQVVILPGCNHGNGMYKQTELFQTAIKDFLKKYIWR
jgi:pimeloyl-ACP methyl ester carboxylesterase